MELGEANIWDKPEYAQGLGKERADLQVIVGTIDKMISGIVEVVDLFNLAYDESDFRD